MFNEKAVISQWVADMYDQKVTETDDVDFLLSVIGQAPKRILEVCCGSGRILVPLAQAGHTVTGFDADEFMLAKISDKAGGLDAIKWRKADAVYDDWGTGYDVVLLAGNILFNIISDMDNEQAQELFIQKAASALAPGGHVYIDYQPGGHSLAHPEKEISGSGAWIVWEGGDSRGNTGRMILIGGHYDPKTRVDWFTRRFVLTLKDGQTIEQDIPSAKHFATLEQLRGWLVSAGLTVEREYGDYDRNPIGETTHRAIIYARKI